MNNIKAIRVSDEERLKGVTGETAIVTTATQADSYQINGFWQDVRGYEGWEYGKAVEAVNASRHQFKQGDILAVKEITGEVIFIAEINQIQMIDFQHLTEDDAQALRYRDLAEFRERRQAMLGRKAWLFRVTVLEETSLG